MIASVLLGGATVLLLGVLWLLTGVRVTRRPAFLVLFLLLGLLALATLGRAELALGQWLTS